MSAMPFGMVFSTVVRGVSEKLFPTEFSVVQIQPPASSCMQERLRSASATRPEGQPGQEEIPNLVRPLEVPLENNRSLIIGAVGDDSRAFGCRIH